jgi:hypothetical protein
MGKQIDVTDVPRETYAPSEEEQKSLRLVEDRWEIAQQIRRPHEGDWFVVGAMIRGHQRVEWSRNDGKLVVAPSPRSRTPQTINKLQPKVRARLAKHLKNRPGPVVRPATSELKARLKARATTKALDYIWRKLQLERAYSTAKRWSAITDHGYWWFSWDEKALARLAVKGPNGEMQVVIAPVGDIDIEVGSPWEVGVADPTISYIGFQPWITRTKRRPLSYCEARFPDKAKYITPDGEEPTGENAGDRYAQQLGRLAQTGGGAGLALSPSTDTNTGKRSGEPYVLVKEYFERPCDAYPKGRYIVVGGGVVLKEQDELPYFYDFQMNPYPVVDFLDHEQAGQYWGTTIAAQAVPIQREYNDNRTAVRDHNRLMKHPKLLVFKQHNLAPGSWTADAGEVIVSNWMPGLQPPTPWVPPPINADVWRTLEMADLEIQDLFQIFPEAEGQVGKTTSGFQTNLVQEANDAVHAPDIRLDEMAIEESAYKVRRLMKLGYSPARLFTVMGKGLEPEVFEFHRDDIDEGAEIVVEAGSALPQLKAARMQAVMEMWTAGLLGDPADPAARQKALTMLEMGTNEDVFDSARRDEELATLETKQIEDGAMVNPPEFFHNHDVHYRVHTDALKNASAANWPVDRQVAIRRHIIEHIAFVNPPAAMEHALRYGFVDLVQRFQMEAQQAAMVAPPPVPSAPQDPSAPAPGGGQGNPPPAL